MTTLVFPWFSWLSAGMVLVPLLTSLILVLGPAFRESTVRRISELGAWSTLVLTISTLLLAVREGYPVEVDFGGLYWSEHYSFQLVQFFDWFSAGFLMMTGVLALLVVSYGQVYLHREHSYRRFFCCIFLFWSGLNLLFSAGTLDLLFAGWEFVGISSFLLIAFYWERKSPAQNAFRAYCVYRFCDLGLLLGAWLNHMLWHSTERFSHLHDPATAAALAAMNPWMVALLGGLVLLAASGKSAQFPFLFWLPKAMEGPTPSSAIFYGALSVHAGVYLLIRTYPIWQASLFSTIGVGVVGLTTAIVATLCGRSQSNIKAQIAYASAAQVGLQFVELALGFPYLALVHFIANAGFRCFQILVSPSVVAYLLRLQGSVSNQLRVSAGTNRKRWPESIRASFYVFSISEGYIESMVMAFVLSPLNFIKVVLRKKSMPMSILRLVAAITILALCWFGDLGFHAESISWVLCIGSVLGALYALTEPRKLKNVWILTGASSLLAAVAIILQRPEALEDLSIYVYGFGIFWVMGMVLIWMLEKKAGNSELPFSWGVGRLAPGLSLALIVAFLGVSGFPLSPTFIGEDLLLHHATLTHHWMAAIVSTAFVINGIAIVRSMIPMHYNEYVR